MLRVPHLKSNSRSATGYSDSNLDRRLWWVQESLSRFVVEMAVTSWRWVVDGDLVELWSQGCEWNVKLSLKLVLGRRRQLLEVVTGSTMVWSHDDRMGTLVRLLLWGPPFCQIGKDLESRSLLQRIEVMFLAVLRSCLVISLCSLFLVFALVFTVVVMDFNRWFDLSSFDVAISTESFAGLELCGLLLACAEVFGRSWDDPPNSSLL